MYGSLEPAPNEVSALAGLDPEGGPETATNGRGLMGTPGRSVWLREVGERGKSPTPQQHHVNGHYDLVQFDSGPTWLKSELAQSAPGPAQD